MESDEFFYMVDGNRCDEDLHAPMLATGIHVPSAQAGAFAAMKIGIGRAEALWLCSKSLEPVGKPTSRRPADRKAGNGSTLLTCFSHAQSNTTEAVGLPNL